MAASLTYPGRLKGRAASATLPFVLSSPGYPRFGVIPQCVSSAFMSTHANVE